MTIAIRAEGLSKQYAIGKSRVSYDTFREMLVRKATASWRWVQNRKERQTNGNRIWALEEVSFEVGQGEIVGIIGRNGAGKTTLLKILSRITDPTKGFAEIRGRVASLLSVGTGFHPELTGRENIYLNGTILGMRKREIARKFDTIVSFAEIQKFIDTPVKHYSSGMYVRLAFSVAAHLDPEILLVDEVLAVGDAAFQKKCLGKIQNVAGEGRTVLFVSHNLNAIRRLCSRGILLENGRVFKDGPTEQVINKYTLELTSKISEYAQPEDKEKKINLRRVVLLDGEGVTKTEFDFKEGFTLQIDYEVNEPVSNCIVWTAIWTTEGTEVLVTADYDANPMLLGKRPQGYYQTTVNLPPSWLNAGFYCIVVGISGYAPLAFNYDRVESIYFSIVDSGIYPLMERSIRGSILKPYLAWNTQKLES